MDISSTGFTRFTRLRKKLKQGVPPDSSIFVNLVNPVESESTFAAFFGDTTLTDLSKTSPAILIVPANSDIDSADITPPACEFFARNVEGGGRDQMIEDDRMMLAPVKDRNRLHVIVVEQSPRISPALWAPIERAIDRFVSCVQNCGRQLRKV